MWGLSLIYLIFFFLRLRLWGRLAPDQFSGLTTFSTFSCSRFLACVYQ